MSGSTPLHLTPVQRDALDEIERKRFRRDGGWVPVRTISLHVELGNLVELGLVELRPPAGDAGDDDGPDPCGRRVHGVPFIVVYPREDEQ